MSVRQSLIAAVFTATAALVATSYLLGQNGATQAAAFALIAVVVGTVLSVVLVRMVVSPVDQLTDAARELVSGRQPDPRKDADEFSRLARVLRKLGKERKKQLASFREEEDRLKTVLDAMVEAVFVTDSGGEIVMANRAFVRLVNDEAVGKSAVEVIQNTQLRDAIWASMEGKVSSLEADMSFGTGMKTIGAEVSPLARGSGTVVVLQDLTALRRAERIRRDFVANASHELRTPLTAIRGFAETLQGGAIKDTETATRFVGKIHAHALRLQRLADDLIALSRAETPGEMLEKKPLDVGRLFTELVAGFEGQASAKSISISTDIPEPPIMIEANRWALEHILVNLVDNAIKYTPEGGTVECCAAREGERVVLTVRDNGEGIPKEHHQRIFERFYRVDEGRTRDRGGTGIGLAIVKHLTQRMGANIDVESAEGEGTTFRFRIDTE